MRGRIFKVTYDEPPRMKRPQARSTRNQAWVIASLIVFVALTMAVSNARAGLFDDEEARKAIIEIRARMADQQRAIDGLAKQANDLSIKLEKNVEPAIRSQLDLQNQIENMRQEIAKLRGQIEVQTNELAKPKNDSVMSTPIWTLD